MSSSYIETVLNGSKKRQEVKIQDQKSKTRNSVGYIGCMWGVDKLFVVQF